MFELFKKYLSEEVHLTDEEISKMWLLGIPKKLKRKQFILREGDICRFDCFVIRGCFRLYRINEDGTEHILSFALEHWWMSNLENREKSEMSKNNIDALEDSEVILWTKENFDKLKNGFPALNLFFDQLVSRGYQAQQERIFNVISGNMDARFSIFLTTYPNILYRVPMNMIASYFVGTKRNCLYGHNHYFYK